MEKYIKVENTIYGLQNIKKVEIKGVRKNKKTSKGVITVYYEGWVEIRYMDDTYEIIRLYLEEDNEDKMYEMQKELVEKIYKILLDK